MVIPARDSIHAAVRLCFVYASDTDANEIGRRLEALVKLRNETDYKLASPGSFHDAADANAAIVKAAALIDLLDAIKADPTHRAEIVASIRS